MSKPKLVRQSKVNFNAKEAKAIRKAMQRKFSFCDLGAKLCGLCVSMAVSVASPEAGFLTQTLGYSWYQLNRTSSADVLSREIHR